MAEKSASILPRFLNEGILGTLIAGSSPTSGKNAVPEGISRGFEIFMLSVNRAKTKQAEKQIVERELQTIQTNFSQPNISMAQIRDYLCRLVYSSMLGYDVSFGCIHAIKLAQQGSHIDKKTGYLSCCLLMHREHELILLLVNTIQKDLKSSNILDNMTALTACSQLVPVEMIPSVLPLVLERLKHSRELVRHKAVLCLHQFQLLAPELLEHCHDNLTRALFDKDPGVMAAAMHIVQYNIQKDASKCQDLANSLVSILSQILSRRMTSMFEYHGVPFPWLQIQILKCLSMLSEAHEGLSESLIPLLKKILQASSIKETIAIAVLYECIRCIVNMKAPRYLLDEAAQHVERFLLSNHPNLKFIGVKLLVLLVQVNPEYSVNYQQLIVKSLENGNRNIQKKMHKLLYQIANESNVQVVCSKLLLQLKSSPDKFWRSEAITMVIDLVDRFNRETKWQIETVFSVLQLGNDIITVKILAEIMNMLEKSFIKSQDQEAGQKLLVQRCVKVLVSGEGASSVHVSAWVLGELASFLKNMPDDKVISLFTQQLANQNLPYSTHSCIVTALQHLLVKSVVQSDAMATKISELLTFDLHIVVKQRLSAILRICMKGVIPRYHSESYDLDTTLTFLDELVCQDLESGGTPYCPANLRGTAAGSPARIISTVLTEPQTSDGLSSAGRPRTASSTSSTKTVEESETGLTLTTVKKVWSKQGRLDTAPNPKFSSPDKEVTRMTEEELHQNELASALFGGFQDKFKTRLREDVDDDHTGFSLNIPDKSGWRSLHASSVQAKTLTKPTSAVDDLDRCFSAEHIDESSSKVCIGSAHKALDSTASLDETTFVPDADSSIQKHLIGEENSVNSSAREENDKSLLNRQVKYTADSDHNSNSNQDIELDKDVHHSLGITVEEFSVTEGNQEDSEFDLDQALSALIDSNVMIGSSENNADARNLIFDIRTSVENDDNSDKVQSKEEESLYSGYEEFVEEDDLENLEENVSKNFEEDSLL